MPLRHPRPVWKTGPPYTFKGRGKAYFMLSMEAKLYGISFKFPWSFQSRPFSSSRSWGARARPSWRSGSGLFGLPIA